ncbi:LysR family transcriptional regulator [Breoghania sp.]|uniref:LysR family transcriptional regulator n=1 Tax=Breoghania sp. TaxID=2065378 RepID=UPI0026050F6A|nr:LysR family transcriptional regulator [Breoghania sp.]MDJ0930671.1 LysR family transcriptional regulator [Breoghania sp.]
MNEIDRRLSIEHCRVFTAICDAKSFSLAAERLLRTQSAVIHQIRTLEEILGEMLFLHSRGRFHGLTRAGEEFEPYARRILAPLDDLCSARADRTCSDTVRLGVMDDFDLEGLIETIVRSEAIHPDAHVSTIPDLSANLKKRLREGELDLALIKSLHDADRAPDSSALMVEKLHWVASQNFDWRKIPADLPVVVFHEGCVYRHLLLRHFQELGLSCRIAYVGHSYANVRAAISASLGISILPKGQIAPDHVICDESRLSFLQGRLGFSALKLEGDNKAETEVTSVFRQMLQKTIRRQTAPLFAAE